MEEKIISPEEVEQVKEVLKEARTESSEFIKDLPSNGGDNYDEKYEDIIEDTEVTVDPNTGSMNVLSNEIERIANIDLENLYNIPTSMEDIHIDIDLVIENAKGYGIEDEESANIILDLIKRYKSGEKTNWYNEMPDRIKRDIDKTCLSLNNTSTTAKKLFAEELLAGILRDSGIDRVFLDLETSINKAFDISGIMKMIVDEQSTKFEVEFNELATKLENNGETEKATQLRKVSAAYRESYRHDKLIEKAKAGRFKIREFDISKIDRFISEFNFKYKKDTPFAINNIGLTIPILKRVFKDEFTYKEICAFIIAFIKHTMNMKANDVVDHTYMSYTILNIMNFDLVVTDDQESEFINILKNNISIAIKAVNRIEDEGDNKDE